MVDFLSEKISQILLVSAINRSNNKKEKTWKSF